MAGNGGMAEWRNGGMAELRNWIPLIEVGFEVEQNTNQRQKGNKTN
jgi:hypothetical protein